MEGRDGNELYNNAPFSRLCKERSHRMSSWALILLFSVFGRATAGWNPFEEARYNLVLTNDGPVYYRSSISFTAELVTTSTRRNYDFTFSSDPPVWFLSSQTAPGNSCVQVNKTFSIEPERTGTFVMNVRVTYTAFLIPRTVAEGSMKFVLSDKIPARLILIQNGTVLKTDPNQGGKTFLSSGMPVNASCEVNDPAAYFSSRGVTYKNYWKLNEDPGNYNTTMTYVFPSKPGAYKDFLELTISARLPNSSVLASGALGQNIISLNPVTTLNSTGELYLRRGSITRLDFVCDASPPIYYCYDPVDRPGNGTDFNCTVEHRRDKCEFSAVHYFQHIGDHEVRVSVYNEVNKILNLPPLKTIYKIHIYDVDKKGLLGLFIVPISCIIVGILVAVAGVAFYQHTKGDIRVEVADFDFGGASNSLDLDDPVLAAFLEERTFWTHLRDELAESSPIFFFLSRRRNYETTPPIGEDHILSVETSSPGNSFDAAPSNGEASGS